MALKCLVCGSENLRGHVTLTYDVPLAARGGGIKVGGLKVTQLDVRAAWERETSRPVYCLDCLTRHVYRVGEDEPFRIEEK